MCTPYERKEANRYFWMVKGHLIPKTEDDETVVGYYNSYFKRLWNNESGCLADYEEGFEHAYAEREAEEVSTIAILGYD